MILLSLYVVIYTCMDDVYQPIVKLDSASGPECLLRTDAVANNRQVWIGPEVGWSGKSSPIDILLVLKPGS